MPTMTMSKHITSNSDKFIMQQKYKNKKTAIIRTTVTSYLSCERRNQQSTCNKRPAVSQQPAAENMFFCNGEESKEGDEETEASSRTGSQTSRQLAVGQLVLQNSNVASQPIALAVVEVAAAADAALWKIWHKEPKSNTKCKGKYASNSNIHGMRPV